MHSAPQERHVSQVSNFTGRNQSMEWAKLVASFFVVFIHVPFPGQFGNMVDNIAKFAVPLFFMISGYFNYQASSQAILRRAKHILKLLIIGTLIHLFWSCISTELQGGSTIAYLRAAIPDPIEISNFLILHYHPYAGHLWYLIATLAVYLVFYLYTQFQEEGIIHYQAFYHVSLILFTILFVFDIMLPATGSTIPLFTRNGWLLGLPMFGAGLFIREYQDRIFFRFHITTWKLVLLIVGGLALGVLQWSVTGVGIMAFGTLFAVFALMLLLIVHPIIASKSKIAKKIVLSCGPISTWIYLLHLTFYLCYAQVLQPIIVSAFGTAEGWIRPFVVLAMSFITAVIIVALQPIFQRFHKK